MPEQYTYRTQMNTNGQPWSPYASQAQQQAAAQSGTIPNRSSAGFPWGDVTAGVVGLGNAYLGYETARQGQRTQQALAELQAEIALNQAANSGVVGPGFWGTPPPPAPAPAKDNTMLIVYGVALVGLVLFIGSQGNVKRRR